MMARALIALVALVALGRGGYAPWATLTLEVGAAVLIGWLALESLLGPREMIEQRRRVWRTLPFHVRYPGLGKWLRLGKAPSADVEILLPGQTDETPTELDVGRNAYPFGIEVKRSGLGAPLLLLTAWLVMAVVPMSPLVLERASPEAHRYRVEAQALIGVEVEPAAPWSLAPFLTLRSTWLWVSVMALFLVSLVTSRRGSTAATIGFLLLLLGVGSGVLGMVEWFIGLTSLFGRDPTALRASGSFGNPNHYAAFQGMLLAVSLGWLAYFRSHNHDRTGRPGRPGQMMRGGKSSDMRGVGAIAALGVLLLGLGLFMSLSRSGLAFACAGCAVFVVLTRRSGDRRPLWALGLLAAGFTLWIGLGPLFGRFENLGEQWLLEEGRPAVWRDSVPAVGDYWLTGSGLSSFRYVGAVYRTFGGQIFYSWAHNDYLQLAIELGLPGVLLVGWLAIAVVRAARRVRSDLSSDPALLQLHAGFVAALVSIALHSFTDFSLHIPANLALLAVIVGVVVGLEPERRDDASSGNPRGVPSRRRQR